MYAPPAPVPAFPASAANARIRFRLDSRGKVHYAGRDEAQAAAQESLFPWLRRKVGLPVASAHSYLEMPINDFAQWKGAGKRSPSDKVTDPATGQSWAYRQGRFHPYNPATKTYGPVVPDNDAWTRWGTSSHHRLLARLNRGELFSRLRPDRLQHTAPLAPFDVGPYTQDAVLNGKTYRHLPSSPKLERDHVPSSKSLKLRTPGQAGETAKRTAPAIAIPNADHRSFSPTFRGHQGKSDTYPGLAPQKRPVFDQHHPATALARDIGHMLDSTNAAHWRASIDPSGRMTRLRQFGAYRTLYRMNTRMNQSNPSHGINPRDPAVVATHQPWIGNREFGYAAILGMQQGQQITQDFRRRLIAEQFAR